MLSALRNKKKSITVVLLACVMAVFMLSFGVNLNFSSIRGSKEHLALEINEEKISLQQFQRRLYQLTELYRSQFQQNFEQFRPLLNLPQRVIDNLIEEKLLGDYTHNLGLAAGDRQIQSYLTSMPFFKKFGLNKSNYQSYLNSQGLTGEQHQAILVKQLAEQQLSRTLSDLATISEPEAEALYIAANTKYSFNYISFDPQNFKKNVDVSDEAKLKELYEKLQEKYRAPRSLSFTYVAFKPESFTSKVEVSDEDLQALYQERENSFYEPRQIKYRLVELKKQFKKPSSDLQKLVTQGKIETPDEELNKLFSSKAKELVEKLKTEEVLTADTFEKLAKANSLVVTTQEFQNANAINPEYRLVLDRLEKGRFSDVLETESSYAVLFLEDVKEKRLKEFSEVKAQLEAEYRADKAPEYAALAADEFFDSSQASANRETPLFDFAQSEKLVAEKTPQLLAVSEDIAGAEGLVKKVSELSKGQRDVVKLAKAFYVVEILETKESYIPEFQTVRAKVENDYRDKIALELAEKKARETLATLLEKKDGKAEPKNSLAEIAKAEGLSVTKTEPITRFENGAANPLLSQSENKRKLFQLTKEAPLANTVLRSGMSFYLASLAEIKLETATEDKAEGATNTSKLSIAQREKEEVSKRLMERTLENLKDKSKIWINPEALKGL